MHTPPNHQPNFESFWLKTDFLKLNDFVSYKILKTYYIVFYVTLTLFLITMILLLFPFDSGYDFRTTYLMNNIDKWNKNEDLKEKMKDYQIEFEGKKRILDEENENYFFENRKLFYKNEKYDYIDDYSPTYEESFFVYFNEKGDNEIIEEINFPDDFFYERYIKYEEKQEIAVKYYKNQDLAEYMKKEDLTQIEENQNKKIKEEQKDFLNFKFIKKTSEEIEARCSKTGFNECKEVCNQSNGILVKLKNIHYCLKFKILKSFCNTANFESEVPTLSNGCFYTNSTQISENDNNYDIEENAIYEEMTYDKKTYYFKNIRFLLKDINDPYVIAYKIGENGTFYDIKKRTVLAKFLEYFLGFVTFLTICLFFFYIIISLMNEETYVRNSSNHMIKIYGKKFDNKFD